MKINLIADTNLFLECKRLEDLPWNEIGANEIFLILTKPVMDEIDNHKRSSGRTGKIARSFFSKLQNLLRENCNETLLVEHPRASHYTHLSETQPAPRQVVDLKGLIQVAGDMSGLFVSL